MQKLYDLLIGVLIVILCEHTATPKVMPTNELVIELSNKHIYNIQTYIDNELAYFRIFGYVFKFTHKVYIIKLVHNSNPHEHCGCGSLSIKVGPLLNKLIVRDQFLFDIMIPLLVKHVCFCDHETEPP